MRKIRIYIGHKLTKATPEFIEIMESVKTVIEASLGDQCEFLRFIGIKDGARGDVYDKDIETNVRTCDLFVCITDQESTGLGIEIGASLWKSGKPTLVLYHESAHVSRLVGGTIDRHPQQMMERVFDHSTQARDYIREAIAHYRLDTDDPVRFYCLDYFLASHGIELGTPIPKSNWKS